MSDINNDILEKAPFAQLPYGVKLQFVRAGRPLPLLPTLKAKIKNK